MYVFSVHSTPFFPVLFQNKLKCAVTDNSVFTCDLMTWSRFKYSFSCFSRCLELSLTNLSSRFIKSYFPVLFQLTLTCSVTVIWAFTCYLMTWIRSEYSFACFTYCLELSLSMSSRFIRAQFVQSSSKKLTCAALVNRMFYLWFEDLQ